MLILRAEFNPMLTPINKLKNNLFLFCLILCIPFTAMSQNLNTDYKLIGGGIRARPAYDGADSNKGEVIPVLRYYGKPWFARTTQGLLEGGARIELSPGLALGIQLAYEGGRLSSESAFLQKHTIEDIDVGASVGVHADYDRNLGPMPVTFLVRHRINIDKRQGKQTDVRISAGVFGGDKLNVALFAQTSWANSNLTQTYYGITPQQAAVSGLPTFNGASGLLFSSVGLLWSFDLNRAWVLVGGIEARQLRGDAANSPLVEDHSNTYLSVGLAYRF